MPEGPIGVAAHAVAAVLLWPLCPAALAATAKHGCGGCFAAYYTDEFIYF